MKFITHILDKLFRVLMVRWHKLSEILGKLQFRSELTFLPMIVKCALSLDVYFF